MLEKTIVNIMLPRLFKSMRSAALPVLAAIAICASAGCSDPGDNKTCPGLQRPWHLDADADAYASDESVCSLSRPGDEYYLISELEDTATDCDDADPAVNPAAQEICGDGIDNDCDGFDDTCSQPPQSIWRPSPGTSWQWQLSGKVDTSYDVAMYDIDLFDNPSALIKQLHDDNRTVICYFSAGSWENWRPDAGSFPESVKGSVLEGWPDERWLDIRQTDVLLPLIDARLDMAVSKGCDGVEPDNMDAYTNQSGFPLTADDQLRFNRLIAEHAHARNLSVGLKNDLDQIEHLVDDFDWALNEQCFQYNECEKLLPFVQKGKAVFGVEYELDTDEFCAEANAMNFDWLKKNYDLDAERKSCR